MGGSRGTPANGKHGLAGMSLVTTTPTRSTGVARSPQPDGAILAACSPSMYGSVPSPAAPSGVRRRTRRRPAVAGRRVRGDGRGVAERIFTVEEYATAGASVVAEGTWTDAPHDAYVLGIKELPDEPASLRHRHIYFAHAFKGQKGARRTLERFRRGGGRLFDIEYLTDSDGKRVVAFGYWAGYVGAALGVLHLAGTLAAPLTPMAKHELDAELEQAGKAGADQLLALVTGARGRSGRGAQRALMTAGLPITRWDRQETRDLHKQALLGHDLLVNCVVTHTPTTPFVEQADLDHERGCGCSRT